MNPPEHAQALKEIYQAREELVRQNEAEIADLEQRLKQTTRKQKELLAQMTVAKANYEEASTKIVDLLDDGIDLDVDVDVDDADGKDIRDTHPRRSERDRNSSIKKERRKKDEQMESPTNYGRNRNAKSPPSVIHEVLDLVDSDDHSDSDDVKKNDATGSLLRMNDEEKYSTLENCGREKRSNDSERGHGSSTKKRVRSSSTINSRNNVERKAAAKPEHIVSSTNSTDSSDSQSNREKPFNRCDVITPTQNGTEKNAAITTSVEKASSTNSGSHSGKTGSKKRGAAKSRTSTRKVVLRSRPNHIPLEQWLKSSIGRTREELNAIDDMVQYMGSCKFGMSCVCSKFNIVHAVVLNDEWNNLAQRNDEPQIWYVGLGPKRKRDARLVGASQSPIPIFQAPKLEYTTKELFYVGHYKVMGVEEFNPPIVEKETERDMKLTLAFDRFDKRLDSIIKRGLAKSSSSNPCRKTWYSCV